MKTNEVKETIYCFLKEKLSKKFPEIFPLNPKGATNKIFWANLKFEKPQRPFSVSEPPKPQTPPLPGSDTQSAPLPGV